MQQAYYQASAALKSAAAAAQLASEGNRAAADYHNRNSWESAILAVAFNPESAMAACLDAMGRGLNPVTGWGL